MARKRKPRKRAPARPTVAELEREDGTDSVTQLAVRIPTRLYRKMKIRSIGTGDSMSKLTEDAYRTFLREGA